MAKDFEGVDFQRARALFDELSELPHAEQSARLAMLTDLSDADRAQIAAWLAVEADAGKPKVTVPIVQAELLAAFAQDRARSYVDPFIGQSHRDFRLIKALGQGGMGKVYRGVDTMLDREALRVFTTEHPRPAHAVQGDEAIMALLN